MNSLRSSEIQFGSAVSPWVRAALAMALLCSAGLQLRAANVLILDNSSGKSAAIQQVETAADFYGITWQVRAVAGTQDRNGLLAIMRAPELLAVVVDAKTLPTLDRDRFLASLQRRTQSVPLFITGINESTNAALISYWSLGAVTGGRRSSELGKDARYLFATESEVTRQLGGSTLPVNSLSVSYLPLQESSKARSLVDVISGGVEFSVFAEVTVGIHRIFFSSDTDAAPVPISPDPYRQQMVFAGLFQPLLFLRYAGGEHVWHSTAQYANFTIDDLWLKEPYGHVNYRQLYEQAELHNFHATIAFIPWNFDRNQVEPTHLFLDHPDRLSICVHGNNHVHQEFGPFDSHPLSGQTENLKQAIARMEKFHQTTGIPYDAVMVFPHSVAPEGTFAELKRLNYLSTANSLNVPSDKAAIAGVDFALRATTLQYADFPSMRRYSVETEVPHAQIAIDAFLGNPVLFYAHEGFFAAGIGAFNGTADYLNSLDSSFKWSSLGTISKHLYLEKIRDDGDFDIRAESAVLQIHNSHQRDAVFYVEKEENFSEPVTVTVDGAPYAFERSGNKLRLRLMIEKGKSRELSIRYSNDFNVASTDIAKRSIRVRAIRLLSDFRDNSVSNSALGRSFIHSYANHGRSWNLMFALLASGLCFIAVIIVARRNQVRSHRLRQPVQVQRSY